MIFIIITELLSTIRNFKRHLKYFYLHFQINLRKQLNKRIQILSCTNSRILVTFYRCTLLASTFILISLLKVDIFCIIQCRNIPPYKWLWCWMKTGDSSAVNESRAHTELLTSSHRRTRHELTIRVRKYVLTLNSFKPGNRFRNIFFTLY